MFHCKRWCVTVLLSGVSCVAYAQTSISINAFAAAAAESSSSAVAGSPSAIESTSSSLALTKVAIESTATTKKGLVWSTGLKQALYTPPPARPFSQLAIAIGSGILGDGIQVATNINPAFNLRAGFNYFNISLLQSANNTNYGVGMKMTSGEVKLDWFPFRKRKFHISPGLLLMKSDMGATLGVAAGNSFALDDQTYISSSTDPVSGKAGISFGRTLMPSVTFGFSNMMVKRTKHWSVPFEFGAAYTGVNTLDITLKGTACQNSGCLSTTDPSIQTNLVQQQAIYNEDLKRFKVFPIITSGLAYRF